MLNGEHAPVRVFVQALAGNARVIVAQSTTVRDEIAIDSALRTIVPIALFLPMLAWLVARIVATEFRPVFVSLRRLSTPALRTTEDDDVIVEVIDTGAGIPESSRDSAFEPFHRLSGARGEGCGLGLTIARDAALRLGGTVSLHGRPGGPGLVLRYRQRGFASDALAPSALPS